jgi:hypothetical protein
MTNSELGGGARPHIGVRQSIPSAPVVRRAATDLSLTEHV